MALKIKNVRKKDPVLVREVGEDYKPSSSEKLCYQSQDTQEVLLKKSIFKKGKNWKYFVFDTEKVFEFRDLTKTIHELDDSLSLELRINCKIQLMDDLSPKFLRSFIATPREAFDDQIANWIEEFVSDSTDFVSRFFELQGALADYIQDQALQIGMKIEASIIPNEPDIESDLQSTIEVRVTDYLGKVKLEYEVLVETLEQQTARIVTSKISQIKQEIDKAIKSLLIDNKAISLQRLYFHSKEFGDVSVKNLIYEEIVLKLKSHGLRPSTLELTVHLDNVPPDRKRIKCKVEGDTQDGSVTIDHTLLLVLEDLGKFYSRGISDIEKEVRNILEQTTQDYIFSKNLTELLATFDDAEIKNSIKQAVAEFGYSVNLHVTNKDLINLIPKRLSIVLANEQFRTSVNGVEVKMGIEINCPFIEIAMFSERLSGEVINEENIQKSIDILNEDIKTSIREELRQAMHLVEPERFYFYFDNPKDVNTKALAPELKNLIFSRLESEYGINEPRIIINQLETELVKVFNGLLGQTQYVNFENREGSLRYEMPFEVIGVNPKGWNKFKAKSKALNGASHLELLKDIAKKAKHFMEDSFNIWEYESSEDLHSPSLLRETLAGLIKDTLKVIQNDFGLMTEFSVAWKLLPPKDHEENVNLQKKIGDNKRKKQELLLRREIQDLEQKINMEKGNLPDDIDGVSTELNELSEELLKPKSATAVSKQLPAKSTSKNKNKKNKK